MDKINRNRVECPILLYCNFLMASNVWGSENIIAMSNGKTLILEFFESLLRRNFIVIYY